MTDEMGRLTVDAARVSVRIDEVHASLDRLEKVERGLFEQLRSVLRQDSEPRGPQPDPSVSCAVSGGSLPRRSLLSASLTTIKQRVVDLTERLEVLSGLLDL